VPITISFVPVMCSEDLLQAGFG